MSKLSGIFSALFTAALLCACSASAYQASPQNLAKNAIEEQRAPVTILISIDGFRPDYLDRGVTPVMSKLAAGGASAAMIPSFPSKTFPNHWALVTGKYPDHNGITANRMEDPRRPGEVFTMQSDDPFWWNEAEPIWVAAEAAGVRTATTFWPGSNVAWGGSKAESWPYAINGGSRPSDWQQFNQEISGIQRVNAVLDYLRRPADIRPQFLTLYFDTVDTAGHRFGPDDARTTAAVAEVDTLVGRLAAGLALQHQPANLVIVADHGMTATDSARTIALDQIADPSLYRIVESGPYASMEPTDGNTATLAGKLLVSHAHMQCWRKADIPQRLHYGSNARIPAFFCLAEDGWQIQPTAPASSFTGGNHGYDNRAADMAALFIASGPAFVPGAKLPAFENVSVAPLLRHLLGIAQSEDGDGSLEPLQAALKE